MKSEDTSPAEQTLSLEQLAAKQKLNIISNPNSSLLLISPHGFHQLKPKEEMDDDYTAEIVEAVAEKIGCSAIINYKIRKTVLDLNKISQAKKHSEFIPTIRDFIGKNENMLLVWVHGIDDVNIPAEAIKTEYKNTPEKLHAVVGYGQGKKPRYTASAQTIDSLLSLLSENGMNTVLASFEKKKGEKTYCGYDKDNMNQWFNQEKTPLSQVQSVQIEIRKKGFREKEYIDSTAEILANALIELLKISNTTSELLPAKQVTSKPAEPQPDNALVEKAYAKLSGIFIHRISQAMLEAGDYLLKEFYGDNIERAYQKKPLKNQSLRQLILKLHNSQDDVPSKSWIYNALNLAVDTRRFKKVSTYGQLGKSHKVLLTHIHNLETKKQLIDEIDKNGYTVAQLKERISELKEQKFLKGNKPTLSIDNPPSLSELRKLDTSLLSWGVQEAIDLTKYHEDMAGRYRKAQKKIASALEDVQALAIPEDATEKKRIVGFRDWTKPGNIVNICFGCQNDCIYCFNKAPAYRRGWIKKGHWKDEVLREKEIDAKRKLFNGRVAFPTTHDITPKNLEAYLTVLGKLLKAGNEVLIVSKPRLECIKRVCDASAFFRNEILFRFTIGATDDAVLKFWEPNAPSYAERKASLEYAFNQGFKTSVSIEPMLDSPNIDALVADLKPFVNDALWIGTFNHITEVSKAGNDEVRKALETIEANQTKEKIQPIYDRYKDDPQIKWKDKIKKMMGVAAPPAPGMDV